MYNEKVIDHFQNPRNAGEMLDPNGVGEVGNMTCGDIMKIFVKVEDDIIKDIKFLTFGCGAAIASSSALTEMVKGKTVEEALKITNQDVAEELGGLPEKKLHCSNLAADAFQKAIEDYRKNN
jgi:nitrogen fixation NifU-like protein